MKPKVTKSNVNNVTKTRTLVRTLSRKKAGIFCFTIKCSIFTDIYITATVIELSSIPEASSLIGFKWTSQWRENRFIIFISEMCGDTRLETQPSWRRPPTPLLWCCVWLKSFLICGGWVDAAAGAKSSRGSELSDRLCSQWFQKQEKKKSSHSLFFVFIYFPTNNCLQHQSKANFAVFVFQAYNETL